MRPTSHAFRQNARDALADDGLRQALGNIKTGFVPRRLAAVAALPEFEALRDAAAAIKNHTLAHLDVYLESYERAVIASGGQVHWARNAAEARDIILGICRAAGARTVTKGKSMIAEEIALNDHLAAHGVVPVETDLGEYIIQLRGESPSHIIAPAIHLVRRQITDTFLGAHADLDPARPLGDARALTDEARSILRRHFLAADVGITGANFLVAETGSSIIVTNEGNGDLTQTLPRVHVVLASIEKLVPTLADATTLLRVLARSATGQECSTYTTVSTGPRRADDPDGPAEYHVVLLDGGRTAMLGTPFQEMLRCIRCAACLNHCPVYQSIGGHAYGWIYPGPMGAVLTPQLVGIDEAGDLPNATTFCGKCESVCPVKIPLPKMMRHWRERQFDRRRGSAPFRAGLGLWAFLARRPRLYRLAMSAMARVLGRRAGRFRRLPLAGGWTAGRDFPAPARRGFHARWAARK